MSAKSAFLASLALFCCYQAVESGPLHASCKLTWTWDAQCAVPFNAIITQMKKWNSSAPCGSTEKCRYAIKINDNATKITGTHTTPVKHYVDDLTMSFTQSTSGGTTTCTVQGYSTSETWYAVLDDGTNYCNLHNLVNGAGIDTIANFNEQTSDSICTQYSSRNCAKY